MAEKTYVMTQAEKEQLEAELEEYKLVRRPEVVERIKIARSYGDLSENSEYEAAKDEQAFVEGQIQILETKNSLAESLIVMLLLMTRLQLVKQLLFKKLVQTTKILIISLVQPVLISSQVKFQMKAQLLKP